MRNYLKNKKVLLLKQYEDALDYNRYHLAKAIKTKLMFIDELISEVK